jgi:hypothetical protein
MIRRDVKDIACERGIQYIHVNFFTRKMFLKTFLQRWTGYGGKADVLTGNFSIGAYSSSLVPWIVSGLHLCKQVLCTIPYMLSRHSHLECVNYGNELVLVLMQILLYGSTREKWHMCSTVYTYSGFRSQNDHSPPNPPPTELHPFSCDKETAPFPLSNPHLWSLSWCEHWSTPA